tara:strand:- start:44 stop:472 length:429 start_codon:yes stop_codon:yes gene_type:complete
MDWKEIEKHFVEPSIEEYKKKFILEGPFFISHDEIYEDEDWIDISPHLKRHYDSYINEPNIEIRMADKQFFEVLPGVDIDPRKIDFKTCTPIILNTDYSVYDGRHRTLLVKLAKSSIRAYRIIKKLGEPKNKENNITRKWIT